MTNAETGGLTPLQLEELAWLDRCRRRIWLDRVGGPPPELPPARDGAMRSQANRAHARRVVAGIAGVAAVPDGPWEQRSAETLALAGAGAPLIAWGAIEAPAGGVLLRANPHLLRRTPDPLAPRGWTYQPIDIRLHGEPTRWDRVRLDALRWLVGQRLEAGRVPPGELWLGNQDGLAARVLTRRADASGAGPALIARREEVAAGPEPPIWFDSDHCPFCPWRDRCDLAATERRDLALLAGLRRSHARALRAEGVTDVPGVAALSHAQLAALPDSDGRVARVLQSNAEALLSGAPIRRHTIDVAPDSPLFLDIETDPLSRVPWAIGWLGARGVVVAVVAEDAEPRETEVAGIALRLVASVEDAWRLLAEQSQRAGAIAHWGDAESLLLGRTAALETRARLGPRLFDLHAALTSAVALPIARASTRRSAGLKTVAGWLGYRWPEGADHWSDGWDAYLRWRAQPEGMAAEIAGGFEALAPALLYLRADIEALAHVWRWALDVSAADADA